MVVRLRCCLPALLAASFEGPAVAGARATTVTLVEVEARLL